MPIPTLNDPISGEELKSILVQRFRALLDRDSTLINDIAYAGFESALVLNLKYKRSRSPGTLIWANDSQGDMSDDGDLIHDTLKDDYETDSPNEARDDHNLPIPTLVQGPNGPERVKVHIPEGQRRGPGRPKRES
jgi:hypothetical protein